MSSIKALWTFNTKVLTSVAESCDAATLFSRQSENTELYRFVQYLKTRVYLGQMGKSSVSRIRKGSCGLRAAG